MRPAFKFESAPFAVVMLISAIALGCASAPRRLDASAPGIHTAEALGIADVPQASVHMKLARKQLKLAEEIAENDEWAQAEMMLFRAKADAELALLLFHEDAEKSETRAAVERVRQLREDKRKPAVGDNRSNEGNTP